MPLDHRAATLQACNPRAPLVNQRALLPRGKFPQMANRRHARAGQSLDADFARRLDHENMANRVHPAKDHAERVDYKRAVLESAVTAALVQRRVRIHAAIAVGIGVAPLALRVVAGVHHDGDLVLRLGGVVRFDLRHVTTTAIRYPRRVRAGCLRVNVVVNNVGNGVRVRRWGVVEAFEGGHFHGLVLIAQERGALVHLLSRGGIFLNWRD